MRPTNASIALRCIAATVVTAVASVCDSLLSQRSLDATKWNRGSGRLLAANAIALCCIAATVVTAVASVCDSPLSQPA